jgi:polyhydroxyalkanoate synthesis regulator phasin
MSSKSRKKPAGNIAGIVEGILSLVRTSVFAGLGVAFLGEDKIEKWAKEIAKENKLSTRDVSSFIKDVKKQSNQARKDVEKRVKNLIDEVLPTTEKKHKKSSKKKAKSKKKAVVSKKKSHSSSSVKEKASATVAEPVTQL